jgi:hypothetical protein
MELSDARSALTQRLGVDRTALDRARKDNQVLQYPQLISDEVLEAVALPLTKEIAAILAARVA